MIVSWCKQSLRYVCQANLGMFPLPSTSTHCTISKHTQIVQIFVYFLSNNVLHMFTATKLSSTNTPAQTHSMQKSPPSPGWPRDQRFMLLQYECACYHLSGPVSNHCLFWLECKKRKKKKKKGRMIHPRIINRLGLEFTSGRVSSARDCDVTTETDSPTETPARCVRQQKQQSGKTAIKHRMNSFSFTPLTEENKQDVLLRSKSFPNRST